MPPARGLWALLIFRRFLFRKDRIAIGSGAFGFGFHIVDDVLQLIFLFRTQPVRLRSKQLPFEFGDLGFRLGDPLDALLGKRSQPLQSLCFGCRRLRIRQRLRNLPGQPLVFGAQGVAAHRHSS
jgi:hypothetical protein